MLGTETLTLILRLGDLLSARKNSLVTFSRLRDYEFYIGAGATLNSLSPSDVFGITYTI